MCAHAYTMTPKDLPASVSQVPDWTVCTVPGTIHILKCHTYFVETSVGMKQRGKIQDVPGNRGSVLVTSVSQ